MQSGISRASWILLITLLFGIVATPAESARAQDDFVSGVDGATYTSPTFGYSFEWDEGVWEVADEFSEDGYDDIYLSSELADLYFEGMYFYEGDPEQCIEGERAWNADEGGLGDLEPVTDDTGAEIAESSVDNAYAFFSVAAAEDGSSDEFIVYIECQVIVPEAAVLVVTALFAPGDDQALEEIQAVLNTVELGADGESTFDASDVEQLARESADDVDAFWTTLFEENGMTYEEPAYITFQGPIETECGDAFGGESGPFYCPADLSVYIDIDYFNVELLPQGVVVIRVVMAHEIAHHVQELLQLEGCYQDVCGEAGNSLAIELQADCLAGVWTSDAADRDIISASDIKRVEVAVTEYFGDPPGTPMDDPEAHGSGEDRDEMFTAGFDEGIDSCGLE